MLSVYVQVAMSSPLIQGISFFFKEYFLKKKNENHENLEVLDRKLDRHRIIYI